MELARLGKGDKVVVQFEKNEETVTASQEIERTTYNANELDRPAEWRAYLKGAAYRIRETLDGNRFIETTTDIGWTRIGRILKLTPITSHQSLRRY